MLDIYTKDYCIYCKKLKRLLDELKIEYKDHDITATPDKIEELHEKSGMMTVPQVFVGEKCLGGYSDVEKLHQEGKLMDEIKN
ncbi:glutaredoxin [Candidatus Peregrinibacteria bacterium]|nr:glutaredoxin [Candidatus Peregrinibacteria bacterium]